MRFWLGEKFECFCLHCSAQLTTGLHSLAVRITFTLAAQEVSAINGEIALQYGPLLLAQLFDSQKQVKERRLNGSIGILESTLLSHRCRNRGIYRSHQKTLGKRDDISGGGFPVSGAHARFKAICKALLERKLSYGDRKFPADI